MITVVGEALIHLARTSDATMLRASPGGNALNVAVAAARLGYPAALIARLSRDLYGQQLRRYAEENQVDLSGATDADEPTMIAVDATGTVEGAPAVPGTRARLYPGGTSSPHWAPDDLAGLPRDTSVLHVGSLVWTDAHNAARILLAVSRLRQRGAAVWLDLKVYPEMMKTPGQSRILLERALRSADIIHAGACDISWLYPGRAPQAVAQQWLGLGPAMVIVTSRKGAMVVRESGSVRYWPPASPARLVDRGGAKETFTAVLLGALHDRAQKGESVRTLPAAGLAHLLGVATLGAEITCERAGADSPTAAELEERASREHRPHERRFMER
ncbi:MAG: PfkB family carbohydrate kinase [Trebonia sp.]